MASQAVFKLKKDKFGGIFLDTKKVSFDSVDDFSAKLKASMTAWREENVRGLWIKVNTSHCHVISACVDAGFDFHHAQPGYVLMTSWLPSNEDDMLPAYANHYLGSAGFVINDAGHVLVVKERYTEHARWKLPGGMSNPGEDIGEAARREVWEETGVDAQFVCILAFRHQHGFRHGCSDLYFVSLMRAASSDIQRCEREIADCRWMKVDDYLSQDLTDANRYFVMKYREWEASGGATSIRPQPILSHNKTTEQLIYSLQTESGQ